MNIRRISRNQIDTKKWDKTIKEAVNSLPYSYSWYLDIVSDYWEAIIVNDYEFILPLPYTKILGFKLYSQPILCQQLGPFGKTLPNEYVLEKIFDLIPFNALRFNINFSRGIEIPSKYKHLNVTRHINQIIDLSSDLDNVLSQFKGGQRRAVVSKLKNFSDLEEINDPAKVLDFIKNIQKKKFAYSKKLFQTAFELFNYGIENKSFKLFQLKNINTNKVVVMGAIIIDKNRLINLLYASQKGNINYGAASIYIYKLLSKFHHEKLFFDLEGSDIPGVNKFFNSFGAKTTYYHRINKMHPLLKLIYKAKVYLRTRKVKG